MWHKKQYQHERRTMLSGQAPPTLPGATGTAAAVCHFPARRATVFHATYRLAAKITSRLMADEAFSICWKRAVLPMTRAASRNSLQGVGSRMGRRLSLQLQQAFGLLLVMTLQTLKHTGIPATALLTCMKHNQ